MICGEEPEMCVRLRRKGWRIWRINTNMTIHDAAWTGSGNGGNAPCAVDSAMHRARTSMECRPSVTGCLEYRRTWMWGLVIPYVILLLSITVSWKMLALLGLYPLQMIRLAINGRHSAGENWRRAVFLVLGKFPEMLGQVQFMRDRFLRVQSRLIEYK